MARHLPEILAVLLLCGIAADRLTRPWPGDAGPYHQAIREAARSVPVSFGDWNGVDMEVPAGAQALLRPNVVVARAYYSPSRRMWARLVLVQCRDPRDMLGHHPPICYPSHGWREVEPVRRCRVAVGEWSMEADRYHFVSASGGDGGMVIRSFFVLPRRGVTADVAAVRRQSSNYLTRGYGAAQVQVLLDEGLSERQEAEVFAELLEPILPMIGRLQAGGQGVGPP
jgi:hypothetical protein